MPLTVLFLFFRNFLWITTSITVFECYLIAVTGNPQVILVLLWTKLASDLVIGFLFAMLQGHKLYFYYNLGYSRVHLFGGALVFDLIVWTSLMTVTLLIA